MNFILHLFLTLINSNAAFEEWVNRHIHATSKWPTEQTFFACRGTSNKTKFRRRRSEVPVKNMGYISRSFTANIFWSRQQKTIQHIQKENQMKLIAHVGVETYLMNYRTAPLLQFPDTTYKYCLHIWPIFFFCFMRL